MSRLKHLLWLAVLPGSAFAHSPVEGLNFFYNGLLHPVLVPTQLLALIALGLFLGQQASEKIRATALLVPGAAILGLSATLLFQDLRIDNVLLAATTLLGLTVAIKPSAPRLLCLTTAGILSFLVGLDSSQGELSGVVWGVAILGNLIGISLVTLYAAGLSTWCQKVPWKSIGIRVGGSWLTASSFLVFALAQTAV